MLAPCSSLQSSFATQLGARALSRPPTPSARAAANCQERWHRPTSAAAVAAAAAAAVAAAPPPGSRAMAAPLTLSAMERLQRFVEREDESYLEKPILLEKESGYRNFQCCLGALQCLGSWGISALLCPIGTCAPYTMFPQFSLRLDKDSVQLSSAVNDCCCHVAATQKTVPLEKVQVRLAARQCTGCLRSCMHAVPRFTRTCATHHHAPPIRACIAGRRAAGDLPAHLLWPQIRQRADRRRVRCGPDADGRHLATQRAGALVPAALLTLLALFALHAACVRVRRHAGT